jgi:pSer/pThr/pTyr-binding forkhead associated (FHA) protein
MYAGKNMSLPEGKAIVLGRNRDVDLPLNDPKLSRRHCQITATENGCIITDLSSTNGTFVNGNRLEAEKQLELIEFDRIVLGDTEIELYLSEPGEKILAISSDDNMPVVRIEDDNSQLGKSGVHSGIQSATLTQLKAIGDETVAAGDEISTGTDPLMAALYEMGLPLPPEPHAEGAPEAPVVTRNIYCGYCKARIPEADVASGAARPIRDKIACRTCLAKPEPGSAKPEVEAVLAGLDTEPTVIDTTRHSRRTVVERDKEAGRSAPGKDSPPMGDEFEEIV